MPSIFAHKKNAPRCGAFFQPNEQQISEAHRILNTNHLNKALVLAINRSLGRTSNLIGISRFCFHIAITDIQLIFGIDFVLCANGIPNTILIRQTGSAQAFPHR